MRQQVKGARDHWDEGMTIKDMRRELLQAVRQMCGCLDAAQWKQDMLIPLVLMPLLTVRACVRLSCRVCQVERANVLDLDLAETYPVAAPDITRHGQIGKRKIGSLCAIFL